MAAAALRPQIMDFVDGIISGKGRELYMEEVLIDYKSCPFVGQSLGEARLRAQTGALILAIRRASGELIGGPTAETILMTGDVMISMGTAEQLRALNKILDADRCKAITETEEKLDKEMGRQGDKLITPYS